MSDWGKMVKPIIFCCFILLGIICPSFGLRSIVFPSGEVFEEVDPATVTNSEEVADPRNTGSYLFNADAYHERRLTANYYTKDFRSDQSEFFRAHPVFMQCVQKIRTRLQLEDKDIEIVSGFKTKSEAGTNIEDEYARSGCGATLKFTDTSSDVKELAAAAVTQCTLLFSRGLRDIGIVLRSDRISVFMTGADDTVPHFSTSGHSMTTAEFITFCRNTLEEAISPIRGPDCGNFIGLAKTEVFPEGASSPEAAVGGLDENITRSSPDFRRLIQYMGSNIEFEDSQSSSSWCGSPGQPCVDCKNGYVGNSRTTRCAGRMMSYRLYRAVVLLQKLVRETTTSTLKVLSAWDEPHSNAPGSDSDKPDSLHFEGRAAKLQISGNTDEDSMETLSWLAICSGMDYVANKENHVFVAVRKQGDLQARTTQFTDAELLHVLPPTTKADKYKLEPEEDKQHPLFDSSNKEDLKLGQHSTIDLFKSRKSDARYFRIDTALPACFDSVFEKERMISSGADKITVLTAYMTTAEQNAEFGGNDKRYGKFNTGTAMIINYSPPKSNYTKLLRLVKSAIDRCANIFYKKRTEMGIGLYPEGIYIDMRDSFTLWKDDNFEFPPEMSPQEFFENMNNRYEFAMRNRIIDPDDLETVCGRTVPPQPQSHEFQFRHPKAVQQHRLKRAIGLSQDEQCVPVTNTAFCTQTKSLRENEVEVIMKQIKRKHLERPENDIKTALEGCFKACGTCVTGQVYEDKIEHCDNLLHWVPFTLMNEAPDISNLYTRSNLEMKRHACYSGGHCVDGSPLLSLIAPTFNRRYRPDPNKSPEEELYSLSDNPSPVYELLHRQYAFNANGTVTVWVKDEAELATLRLPLQMAMAYNRNVTDVKFYVSDSDRIGAASSLLESMIADWVKSTCTHWGREFIPPFTLEELPPGISKRSADAWAAREEFLLKEQNWEKEWLRKSYN